MAASTRWRVGGRFCVELVARGERGRKDSRADTKMRLILFMIESSTVRAASTKESSLVLTESRATRCSYRFSSLARSIVRASYITVSCLGWCSALSVLDFEFEAILKTAGDS